VVHVTSMSLVEKGSKFAQRAEQRCAGSTRRLPPRHRSLLNPAATLPPDSDRLSHSVENAARRRDCGRSTIFELVRDGRHQRAAWAAACHWRTEGRGVHIAMPNSPTEDFNDLLARHTIAAELTHG
jgi:hypothetical protein